MPFDIPTLPALVQQATDDLSGGGIDEVLRRSDSAVVARMHGGGLYGVYGLVGWVARQILPDRCDENQLIRWADLKGVPRVPAASAVGHIVVSGADGVIVPVDLVWQTKAGQRLIVSADTEINAGVAIVPVVADVAGQVGNVVAGARVDAVSPTIGVVDRAVVDADGVSGGTDIELVESWRRRVCRAFQIIAHGGDADDYVTWALDVPGVTRAWCRRNHVGPGTVGVFFVRDRDEDIVPSATEVAEVQAKLNKMQPVTAEPYAIAPQLLLVNYVIQIDPDTDLLRTRVEDSLRALHQDEADLGLRLPRSHMRAAISATAGEYDHRLIEPVDDVVPGDTQLPVFGGISWV